MNKKVILAGIVGFILGAVVLGLIGFLAAPGMMIVEDESRLGYDETVQAIQDAAAEHGWKVPTIHELDKSVGNAGYDVPPAVVLELCQPHHAARILQDDDSRVVVSMMPCRVAVYETSDGTVIISRMNTSLVSKFFGGLVTEVMALASSEMEDVLSVVLP